MKDIVFFTDGFIPTQEFTNFINSLDNLVDKRTDERIINYIKENGKLVKTKCYDTYSLMGEKDSRYLVGHAGAAYIIPVDTTRIWMAVDGYNSPIGYKKINYVNYHVTPNGELEIIEE